MADPVPAAPAPALPTWASQLFSLGARHALTAIGGFLLAKGVLTPSGENVIIADGVPILLMVIGVVFSIMEKQLHRSQFVQALLTPPPQIVALLQQLLPLAPALLNSGIVPVPAALKTVVDQLLTPAPAAVVVQPAQVVAAGAAPAPPNNA